MPSSPPISRYLHAVQAAPWLYQTLLILLRARLSYLIDCSLHLVPALGKTAAFEDKISLQKVGSVAYERTMTDHSPDSLAQVKYTLSRQRESRALRTPSALSSTCFLIRASRSRAGLLSQHRPPNVTISFRAYSQMRTESWQQPLHAACAERTDVILASRLELLQTTAYVRTPGCLYKDPHITQRLTLAEVYQH